MTRLEDKPSVGVLLVNIGTPDKPDRRSVRKFLVRFLSDRRVISIPAVARFLLVRGIIGPFRSPRSAREYRQVWTSEGSPLTVHSQSYADKLQRALGAQYCVRLSMRYSHPDISTVVAQMRSLHLEQIIVLPMYPQNASSTTGSTVEEVFAQLSRWDILPGLTVIPPFYAHPEFVSAFARRISAFDTTQYDAVLFSYHGLPISHLPACATSCASGDCTQTDSPVHRQCYKYQCYATTRLLANAASIPLEAVHTAFQSRFSERWITPFTDVDAHRLLAEGNKRMLIVCPAFVADCVETIGEIGTHLRNGLLAAGGTQCDVVPCPNADELWAEGSAQMIRSYTFASRDI